MRGHDMPDIHERRVQAQITRSSTVWDTASLVSSRAEKALLQVTPNIIREDVCVEGLNGSTYYRSSLGDGQAALLEDDTKLKSISQELSATSRPDESWTWEAKVWMFIAPDRAHVRVTARTRIVADGIASALSAALGRPAGSEARSEDLVPSVDPPHSATSSSSSDWIRRTWRDHTAAFVITVTGGLVVAALLLALGLQP